MADVESGGIARTNAATSETLAVPKAATLITFYSYKGGVGRSFALANVAALLARWHYRVLCIDWDIEAPGLTHYFSPWVRDVTGGLIDIIEGFNNDSRRNWRDYVAHIDLPDTPSMAYIPAGILNKTYVSRVQSINWEDLYREGLGNHLEHIRAEIKYDASYDFVLIDGRTGVTDFNGIVTAQLPDTLVLLFTANDQSVDGSIDVATRARDARNRLPIDRGRLQIVPVPSRFDDRVEKKISDLWRATFREKMAEFLTSWSVEDVEPGALLSLLTIPYVPFWSFGEKLSVLEEEVFSTSSINHPIENLAAVLARGLARTDLLVEDRDAYVAGARRLGEAATLGRIDIFLSYSRANEPVAKALDAELRRRGFSVFSGPDKLDQSRSVVDRELDRARYLVQLVGGNFSTRQEYELSRFLRNTADEAGGGEVIPIMLPSGNLQGKPAILRQLRFVSIDPWTVSRAAAEICRRATPGIENEVPSDEAYNDVAARLRQYRARRYIRYFHRMRVFVQRTPITQTLSLAAGLLWLAASIITLYLVIREGVPR